jgi:hypothetical protein
MLLLIYFIILFLIFIFRKNYSPSLLLISIYLISLTCGLLVSQNYDINSFFKAFNCLFLAGILTVLILPWNKFNYKISISEPNPKVLRRWTLILLFINGIAFFQVHTEVTDFENFKNNGVAIDVIRDLNINSLLILFSMYFHTTAYFLIPIHFYYLIKNNYFLSTLCFLFSLNIAFFGLTVFSRSGMVEYLFLYVFYFPFFYNGIKDKIKSLLNNKFFIVLILAVTAGFGYLIMFFYAITENRFENADSKSDSFIENPQIYSLFDYASQWFNNSNEVMSTYSFDTLNGELSFPLLFAIANKLQIIYYPEGTIETKLYSLWGDHFNSFNGLIANLLFDLGYLGTILFALLYLLVLRIFIPVRGKIKFNALLILGVIFIIPAMGIFNYQMRSLVYNALTIYSVMICSFAFIFKNLMK